MDDLIGTMLARGFANGALRWPLVRAADLFELRYGKALVETSRSPGGVPVYGTNGQCGWHDSALFKGPGVILGRKGQGPLGVEWTDVDFWVIDTAYSLALRRADVDLRFAYYLIKYIGLNHLKDGTSNPSLSRDTFGAQALPLPPLGEQVRIANVLTALDDKIELNRQTNETLETMARVLFKKWFVDVDVAAHGWRVEPLGDHIGLQRGNTYKSSLLGMPGPYLLGLASIARDGGFRPDKLKTYGGDAPEKLLVQPGELYLSLKDVTQSGDLLGSVARLPRRFSVGRLTQDTVKLSLTTSDIDVAYLYYALQTDDYRAYCRARAIGTTNLSLSREDFLAFPLRIPSKALLSSFASFEAVLSARQELNDDESRTLTEVRDALLPKLLSGELRIRDAERAVEAVA